MLALLAPVQSSSLIIGHSQDKYPEGGIFKSSDLNAPDVTVMEGQLCKFHPILN
jgi:hypothetical protein